MPLHSSAMVASPDRGVVYVADADNGVLGRMSVGSGALAELPVGNQPTRVAVAGDRIFVTLRGDGTLAEVHDTPAGLVLGRVVDVGPEPYGVVATPDGSRIYVALSTADEVVELDGETLAPLRSWTVPDEPRWLALTPNLLGLFVGSAYGGSMHMIHLNTDEVERLELPELTRFSPDFDEGDGDGEVELDPRITGDPAISPDGRLLAVPSLYVDNTTEVPAPRFDGGSVEAPPADRDGGYASSGPGLGRFNPVILKYFLDNGGNVDSDQPPVAFALNGHSGVDLSPGLVSVVDEFEEDARDEDPLAHEPIQQVRTYVTSVVFDPRGSMILGTMEASNTVFAIATDQVSPGGGFADFDHRVEGQADGNPDLYLGVDAGPTAIAFTGAEEFAVWSFLDRSVSSLDYLQLDSHMGEQVVEDYATLRLSLRCR